MSTAHRLLGYADTVGKKIGFLVPVFERQGANDLFVQRVASDGTISGFEAVGHIDAGIDYIDPVPVDVGGEAWWAFAFGANDIVADRSTPFRAALADRIDDPALATRPFLAIEVAEFLDLPALRLDFIRAAVARLDVRAGKTAQAWFDLSVLTPDLREALRRSFPELGAATQKAVATTEGDELIIRGLPNEAANGSGFRLEAVAQEVLTRLNPVHPEPRPRWRVRVLDAKRDRRASHPHAIVWLADPQHWEAANYIQDSFEWRIDTFRSEDLDAFRAQARHGEISAFAVLRTSFPKGPVRANVFDDGKINRIEFGSLRQLQARGLDLLTSQFPGAHIYVPSSGLPGTRLSPKTMATTVRQIVAAVSAIERNERRGIENGSWAFLRATGSGRRPTVDCWAALYDRIWQGHVETGLSYRLDGMHRPRREDHHLSDRYAHALFPAAQPIRDPWLDAEMRNSRADGAVLCFGDRRYSADIEEHGRIVEKILGFQGWEPLRGGDSAPGIDVTRVGALRRFSVEPVEILKRPEWDLRDMMGGRLRSIETVAVTCEANTSAIMAHLYARGELAANMRDICGADCETGIWGILGAQLRRLAGGTLNRSKTHYLALLIDEALRNGSADIEDAGTLADVIAGPTIGAELHFIWNRVRQGGVETVATVRLVAGGDNQFRPTGSDIIAPFSLLLHPDGAILHRADDRQPAIL